MNKPPPVARRSLVAAAAWSVPVIAVGAAAPAVAASAPVTVVPDATSLAGCKEPGKSQGTDWAYHLPIVVRALEPGVLVVTSVAAPGDANARVVSGPLPYGAGTSQLTVVVAASNSANGTAVLTWTAGGVAGSVTVAWAGFRPCERGAA